MRVSWLVELQVGERTEITARLWHHDIWHTTSVFTLSNDSQTETAPHIPYTKHL